MLFITHDLGVMSLVADDTVVLQGGRIVEQRTARKVLYESDASYTRQLLAARDDDARELTARARWRAGSRGERHERVKS